MEELEGEETKQISPMSKLDAILFESDEGPASSLLFQAGSGLESASLPMKSEPHENPKSSSSSYPRTVTFSASTELREDELEALRLKDGRQQERGGEEKVDASSVDKLQEKLYKAQADLASERANRKRKEKSLIKLAKELNNRSSDTEKHNKLVEELEETIEDLESRLADRNRELIVEMPKLSAVNKQQEAALLAYEKQVEGLQKTIGELETTLADRSHELVLEMQKLKDVNEQQETTLSLDKKQIQDLTQTIQNLETSLADRSREWNIEMTKLRAATKQHETEQLAYEEKIRDLTGAIAELETRLAESTRELAVEMPRLNDVNQKQQIALLEHEKKIEALQKELNEAKEETNQRNRELIAHLSKQVAVRNEKNDERNIELRAMTQSETMTLAAMPKTNVDEQPKYSSLRASLLALLAVLVVSLAIAIPHGALSNDMTCSPVVPGTKLVGTESMNMSAPWWVPDGWKAPVFASLCVGRVPASVQVKGGKVDISQNNRNVWTGRGPMTLNADTIVKVKRGGTVDVIPAPWLPEASKLAQRLH